MAETVRPYNSTLSRQIRMYSKTLLSFQDSFKIKISKLLGMSDDGKMPLETQREQLRDTLREQELKVVVFIDDLDRLSGEEVLAVMKIVRNSFNFPNTFFIIAYDHEYILNLLRSQKVNDPPRYLEKIIQLELDLPSFPESILTPQLVKLLAHQKLESAEAEIATVVDDIQKRLGPEPIIRNIREGIRLANAFNHIYEKKRAEVDLTDFLLLEILRNKSQRCYEAVRNRLSYGIKIPWLSNPLYPYDEYTFQSSESKETKLSDLEKNILTLLFNSSTDIRPKALRISANSIRYFSDHLFGAISFTEFEVYNNRPDPTEFIKFIDKTLQEDKESALFDLLQRVQTMQNVQSLTNFVVGFLHFIEKTKELVASKNVATLIIGQQRLFKTTAELKKFLVTILNTETFSEAQGQLAADLAGKDGILSLTSFREFDANVVNEVIIERLASFIDANKNYNHEWRKLFYPSLFPDGNENNEAQAIIRKYIEKFPSDYLHNIAVDESSDNRYLDANIDTYLGWSNFKKLLYSEEEDLHILRLKSFFVQFLANGYDVVKRSNQIYIVSDTDTYFVSSPTYPELQSGNAIPAAFLNGRMDPGKFPELKYSSWITHYNKLMDGAVLNLTKEEQINGGEYLFTRTFNLRQLDQPIVSAKLYFMVDDEVLVIVNGNQIGDKYSQKTLTTLEFDMTKFIKPELITLTFRVFNSKSNVQHIEQGSSNPYGIIYALAITLSPP